METQVLKIHIKMITKHQYKEIKRLCQELKKRVWVIKKKKKNKVNSIMELILLNIMKTKKVQMEINLNLMSSVNKIEF